MKRMLLICMSQVLLLSAQGASQTSARNTSENAGQGTAAPVYSQNPEANDLFLKAREYYAKSDPRAPGGKLANAREAIKLYEQVVKKDPGFALAYVEMARSWLRLGYSDPDGLSAQEIVPPAKAALLKAVALDGRMPEGHVSLAGIYYNLEYDWDKAEREFQLALQCAPNNAATHVSYAAYLGSVGRFDEALGEAKKAEEIAPSGTNDIVLGRIYYSMRRYDEAADFFKRSLEKQDNVLGHFFLGFVYAAQHKYGEAIAEFKTASGFSKNGGALAGLAYGYAMGGRKDDALKLIEELQASHENGLIVPYRVAAVYVALGDKEQALKWLQKDYDERGNWMVQLKVDPVMDPLRADPRFEQLMRRMKFK